jgi:hypothetical protein
MFLQFFRESLKVTLRCKESISRTARHEKE